MASRSASSLVEVSPARVVVDTLTSTPGSASNAAEPGKKRCSVAVAPRPRWTTSSRPISADLQLVGLSPIAPHRVDGVGAPTFSSSAWRTIRSLDVGVIRRHADARRPSRCSPATSPICSAPSVAQALVAAAAVSPPGHGQAELLLGTTVEGLDHPLGNSPRHIVNNNEFAFIRRLRR